MPTLFSYRIRVDDGAAPNPFWGVCTLVICKPVIRRVAQEGDWIVGTGSADSPVGDICDRVVYVMQVTDKISMQEYDAYVHEHLPNKVPHWRSGDPRLMVGDAIYDFSHTPPRVRKSVHDESRRDRDLSGEYALLSEYFYYFGDQPYLLPDHLHGIIKKGQGHRSRSNAKFLQPFLEWLTGLGLEANRLYGKPQGSLFKRWKLAPSFKSECG
jgi:hypothetical protein